VQSKVLASESKVTEMMSLNLLCVHCPVISRGGLYGSHNRQQLYPCAVVTGFLIYNGEGLCLLRGTS